MTKNGPLIKSFWERKKRTMSDNKRVQINRDQWSCGFGILIFLASEDLTISAGKNVEGGESNKVSLVGPCLLFPVLTLD